MRKRLIVNINKYDWETFNTSTIKTIFYSSYFAENDFGTKIRIKCHRQIIRKDYTLNNEKCSNWELIDGFGVRLPESIYQSDSYENFYDPPQWNSRDPTEGLPINSYLDEWLKKYATVNHRSLAGENGFILKNATLSRFEPIGITWNDSYCRRLTEKGPSGCFVERDLSTIPNFNHKENNCTG